MTDGTEQIDETEIEQQDDIDPNDVALALMQGLAAQPGMDPGAAATAAWLVGVPAFFKARYQYSVMQQQAYERQQAEAEQQEQPEG